MFLQIDRHYHGCVLKLLFKTEHLGLRQPSPVPSSRVIDVPSSAVLSCHTTSVSAWRPRTQPYYPVYTPRISYVRQYVIFLTHLPLRTVGLESSVLPYSMDGNSKCPTGCTGTCRGAWTICPGAQPTEQPRRVPRWRIGEWPLGNG